MHISKVVIAAAGLGTRLLPATKELPKEMLPVFIKNGEKTLLKPILQLIFEQLYQNGFREFCFIVGRGKRSVEDHFTPDWGYVDQLKANNKDDSAQDLEKFYEMIQESLVVWVNQPKPKGFGHAVLQSKTFVGHDPFLLAAGDTFIISKEDSHLKRLLNTFKDIDAAILLEEVQDPRAYGVAVLEGDKIIAVEEKPRVARSKWAIMPFYLFHPNIFAYLKTIAPGKHHEIQLTDGIQSMISDGMKVHGVKLTADEIRLDIGTPETYWNALEVSYDYTTR